MVCQYPSSLTFQVGGAWRLCCMVFSRISPQGWTPVTLKDHWFYSIHFITCLTSSVSYWGILGSPPQNTTCPWILISKYASREIQTKIVCEESDVDRFGFPRRATLSIHVVGKNLSVELLCLRVDRWEKTASYNLPGHQDAAWASRSGSINNVPRPWPSSAFRLHTNETCARRRNPTEGHTTQLPHALRHALHGKTEEKAPASWKVSSAKNRCKGWQTKSHKLASPFFQTPPLAHLADLKYFQSLLCATTVAPMATFIFF